MTKQELMETYTAEQLAEMVEKRTPFTDEELIQKWKALAEEFHNGYCKALEEIDRLQSEVEKYRKAFEHAKNERDCQIVEYQKKIEELTAENKKLKGNVGSKDYCDKQNKTNNFYGLFANSAKDLTKDDLLMFLGILTKKLIENGIDFRYEMEKELKVWDIKIKNDKVVADFLPTEPIKVVDMLINASKKRINCMTGKEYDKYIFEKWQLKQIAEHLLVYCNHNGEAEE